jgi:hypothetical protein
MELRGCSGWLSCWLVGEGEEGDKKRAGLVPALSCAEWTRTTDLQVMSLASYHCSTARLMRVTPLVNEIEEE